jgi:hypothetical protein
MFESPLMVGLGSFIYLLCCYLSYFGFRYASEVFDFHRAKPNIRLVLSTIFWPLTMSMLLLVLPCCYIDEYFDNRDKKAKED